MDRPTHTTSEHGLLEPTLPTLSTVNITNEDQPYARSSHISHVIGAKLGACACVRSQGRVKGLTHRNVEEKGADEHEDMPDLVTGPQEVESAWPSLFWKLRGVKEEANHVAAEGG